MAGTAWRPIRGVDFGRLREARLEAHHALQWLARAARAFVMMHPDDRHTNLGWDDALDGFSTHFLTNDVVLRLSIADLTLAMQGNDRDAQLFALNGRTDADVGTWLERMLAAHGLDPDRVVAKLPYQIADRTMADGAAYDTSRLGDALSELAAWFANADQSLGRVREQMIAHGFAPSPVRTWPHHFDMATLTLLETGDAEHVRSVNAGFSPGDEHYEEPYFYVSPHPYPDPTRLLPLPLGHWQVRGFTAAILPASAIRATADRQGPSDAFLEAAVTASITVLG